MPTNLATKSHDISQKEPAAVTFRNFAQIFVFSLITILGLGFAASLSVPAFAAIEIVATVNGKPITNYDLNQRVAFLAAVTNMQVNDSNRQRVENDALQMLIDEKLKLDAAQQRDPNIVSRSLPTARELVDSSFAQNGKSGTEILRELNLDATAIQQKFITDLVWTSFIQAKFGAKFDEVDAKADVELERIKQNALQPQLRLSEIVLLPEPSRPMQQTMMLAAEIVKAVNGGANFNAIAQQYSVAGSAQNGGRVGWTFVNQLPEDVISALAQVEVGSLTAPLQRDGAVYIFQKEGARQNGEADASQDRVWLARALIPLPVEATKADRLEAAARLQRDTETITTCPDISTLHQGYGSNMKSTLDNIVLGTLAPQMRTLATELAPGTPSETLSFAEGVAVFMLCKREKALLELPSRDDIKRNLLEKLFGSLGERYLLRLRRSAVIERS
jgi:peptidyl-prolyl cis-trans isomerase SurA